MAAPVQAKCASMCAEPDKRIGEEITWAAFVYHLSCADSAVVGNRPHFVVERRAASSIPSASTEFFPCGKVTFLVLSLLLSVPSFLYAPRQVRSARSVGYYIFFFFSQSSPHALSELPAFFLGCSLWRFDGLLVPAAAPQLMKHGQKLAKCFCEWLQEILGGKVLVYWREKRSVLCGP